MDSTSQFFSLAPLLTSLENTIFMPMIKDLEELQDQKFWETAQGLPLRAKALTSKLRTKVFQSMTMRIAETRNFSTSMEPGEVSVRTESQPDISQGSTGRRIARASGSTHRASRLGEAAKPRQPRRSAAPATERPNPVRGQHRRAPVAQNEVEVSIASALTNIPAELRPGDSIDYENATVIYEKFWAECQECFVFENQAKREIDINQMSNAPIDWTNRAMEPTGVESMKNYLVNMSDKSAKQTLCVMPDTNEKPSGDWEEIRKMNFKIINGQHSVAASKAMIAEKNVPETILRHFRTWDCFVVWSLDKEKLRRISAFYNRVNHFSIFKPSWATNILSARTIWLNLDRPTPPKPQNTPGGRGRQSINDLKYKVSLSTFSSSRAGYESLIMFHCISHIHLQLESS